MHASLSLHNIVKVKTEEKESATGAKWTTYTFKDKNGKTFEVTAFK